MFISLLLGVSLLVVICMLLWARELKPKPDLISAAKERANQRISARPFRDTEPLNDPYDRLYDMTDMMSSVEVDESANGYGMLTDEQKRTIHAIFDNRKSVSFKKDDIFGGDRWTHSISGELNQLKPINSK
jgi:hypothetical protein